MSSGIAVYLKKNQDRFAFVGLLLVSIGFLVAAAVSAHKNAEAKKLQIAELVVHITPKEALGLEASLIKGTPTSYCLVEFGDYQCPPCKFTEKQLIVFLRDHSEIRYVFRNLPLTSIHHYAMEAAIAAEAARKQGKFKEVHNKLFELSELNSETIRNTLTSSHVDIEDYKRDKSLGCRDRVMADIAFAHNHRITGTPSFLLCCPDGRVLSLHSLDEVTMCISERM